MQTIIVDMTPGFRMPTIYYSQGDVGTQFAIDLRSRFGDTLPESATVTIQATKPSGFGFSVAATSVTNGVATFTTTAEMTDEFGRFPAELKVTKTGLTLFTANFYMDGEENTHPEGTIDGQQETVIPELAQLVERVEDAASSVLDMTVNATTLAAGSQATYSYDEATNTATFGVPQGEAGGGAAGVVASAYSASSTYAVGDYVIHNSNLYRCTTAITTAEAFTAAHWTQVVLGDDVSDLKSDLSALGTDGIVVVPTSLNWQAGYVRANGTTTASSLSQMALVPLRKGQTITVGTRNANTGIISSTTASSISVGDTVTPIQATSGTDQFETYSYTASADINIVICVRASEYTAKITEPSSLALKSDLDSIFDNYSTSPLIPSNLIEGWYVYYSNTEKIAGGGQYSGDAALIDINDCDDVIQIGFDSSITYPGSGHVVMGMIGTSLPADALFYYNSSELVAGTLPSFAERGFDLSTISDGYFTIEKAKLLEALPTLTALAVNFPDGTYLLNNLTMKQEKNVEFLHIAKTVPAIVVAQDGSGDYTTISDAVANASNEDTIYIKDGEYKETVIINKYIHLVGQSKQGTILYQNIGDYDNCPLLITQGSVCNMTIKSIAPIDTSGLTNYAYAIHLDKNFASLAKYQKCEIFNCDIYSEVNDAIGAGANYASEYDIHDCFIHVAHAPVKAGSCGFKCHNGQNQTVGKVRLRNNIIITEDANGGSIYDILFHNGGISNTQPIDLVQVGNVLKYYANTVPTIFVPSAYNFGNSVAEMNTL